MIAQGFVVASNRRRRAVTRVAIGFALGLLMTASGSATISSRGDEPVKWALVIHGGAGSAADPNDPEGNRAKRATLEAALAEGSRILADGGTSLDAVEKVITILEDDPGFNAGRGAVLDAKGFHELDASIMDGATLRCGAVAGVMHVRHPISAARAVMSRTRHVLLHSDGAEALAREAGLEMVDNEFFTAPAQVEQRDRLRAAAADEGPVDDSHKGTVGCVALDSHGHIAAGTSTGGLEGKRFGRIGDSPIIGAGTYANDATCGVSCTGVGEEYIRHAAAFSVSAFLEFRGMTIDDAVSEVLRKRLKPGDGGIIALDRHGNICADFTTDEMAYAAADSAGKREIHWGEGHPSRR